MKKLILILLAVVLTLIIGVVLYLYFNLNAIIKAGIEKYGPEVTGTAVTLESSEISLFSGSGALNGLFIGNPQGFASDRAMSFGQIGVALDTGTVTEDTVVIDTFNVINPKVTLEVSSNGTNLEALQRNVATRTASEPEQEPSEPKKEKKVFIRDIWIKGTEVTVALTQLGGRSVTVNVPDLHLTNIGSEDAGLAASQAVDQILAAWGRQIAEAVSLDISVKDLFKEAGIPMIDPEDLLYEGAGQLGELPDLPDAGSIVPDATDVVPDTDVLPDAPDVSNPLKSVF